MRGFGRSLIGLVGGGLVGAYLFGIPSLIYTVFFAMPPLQINKSFDIIAIIFAFLHTSIVEFLFSALPALCVALTLGAFYAYIIRKARLGLLSDMMFAALVAPISAWLFLQFDSPEAHNTNAWVLMLVSATLAGLAAGYTYRRIMGYSTAFKLRCPAPLNMKVA